MSDRLARIEAKLNLILDHLSIEYHDPAGVGSLGDKARSLADSGNKIAAVKAHREQTGASLREAKQAVDEYMHGARIR